MAAHILQRIEQQAQLVAALVEHRSLQTACRHLLRHLHGARHRPGHRPRHGHAHGTGHSNHQHQRAQQPVARQCIAGFFILLGSSCSIELQLHELAGALGQLAESVFKLSGKEQSHFIGHGGLRLHGVEVAIASNG